MDFANASPGKEAQFEENMNQRIQAVLTLPGWMAAQRFQLADTPGRAPSRKPRYLTIWETEGASAQASNDVLLQAQKNGLVKTNSAADKRAAEVTYWEPITPHITKDDFIR
jgi:heme-degrading monooxygenase HmoA